MTATIKNKIILSCAGSGKTHALIERYVELLKTGAAPGEILTITFTRKAAAEVKQRVLQKIQQEASRQQDWAKEIQQKLIYAHHPQDSLNIFTFHAWFAHLLSEKSANQHWDSLPSILESDYYLRQEAWEIWCQKERNHLEPLVQEFSPASLKKLLTETIVSNSIAWRRFDNSKILEEHERELEEINNALMNALQALRAAVVASECDMTKAIDTMLAAMDAYEQAGDIHSLAVAFYTGKGEMRAAIRNFAEKSQTTAELNAVDERLTIALAAQETVWALQQNAELRPLIDSFLTIFQNLKKRKNVIGFDDLEYQLLEESQQPDFIHNVVYRSHCHYRHILIDEFQDTSPIQWQVIHKWLLDSHGSDDSPSVFVVGDIKQAIYGFRQSDLRVMDAMKKFLGEYYDATVEEENKSRRCSPVILEAVNRIFSTHQHMPNFPQHVAVENVNDTLPGRVEWHEIESQPTQKQHLSRHVRDPLLKSADENSNPHSEWAMRIADKITAIVGQWVIQDSGVSRRLKYEDILVLFPQKSALLQLKVELGRRNIPYHFQGQIDINSKSHFVFQDMIALLSTLLSPYNEQALAAVLRSPLFSFSDALLQTVRLSSEKKLWNQLMQNSQPETERARTLLSYWQQWIEQGQLPIHDLLSRIYHDSDIYSCYSAAVSEPQRPEIIQNLNAFLSLALTHQSGCQPLPQLFLADLMSEEVTLRSSGGRGGGGAAGVRLMTIHAAKGLEAPVVILAETNIGQQFQAGKSDSVKCLIDWLPQNEKPSAFYIKPKKYKHAFLQLEEQLEAKQKSEDANLLYVALTRAKQGLIVFWRQRSRGTSEVSNRIKAALEEGCWGDDLSGLPCINAQTPSPSEAVATLPLTKPTANLVAKPIAKPLRQSAAGQLSFGQRGETIHQIISFKLLGLSDSQISQIINTTPASLLREANQMLNIPELKSLLERSEDIRVEQEFCCENNTVRIDLLLFVGQDIWVVDFKTGKMYEKYEAQLQRYQSIVGQVYPQHTIHAALVFNNRWQPVGVETS